MNDAIFVTGGAGFIGSNFVLDWLGRACGSLVNFDKLTYAGNAMNLESIAHRPEYAFVRGDICDTATVTAALEKAQPRAVVHFAAESHVDRSISAPGEFIRTNIQGTYSLLEAVLAYSKGMSSADRERFRFIHISTDEVYGSLGPGDPPFHEGTPYSPNSPYAASKAASDHLVHAYAHTYGLPAILTHCSNNYGPYQFPEKLIPLVITSAIAGRTLPVYGDGMQVRDWLHVSDHCSALRTVLEQGRPGETYNIGGSNEHSNLFVVRAICTLLDELSGSSAHCPHEQLIRFVADRPGHDRRYAIDATKMKTGLGWEPAETLESGLRKTVQWYLDNNRWVDSITTGAYREWMERNYGQRGLLCGA